MVDGTAPDPGRRGSPALLVSACLLGVACNHRGAASPRPAVAALAGSFDLVPVCPEVEGGLPVPRPAAERGPDGRVRTVDGADVTAEYEHGAAAAVRLAGEIGAVGAVLKARSPSCGCGPIYDGTFTRTLTAAGAGGAPGGGAPVAGVTAEALRAAGHLVISDEDVASDPGGSVARLSEAGRRSDG
jgi:uncharacterized protein YbbK (DUF523 family)